MDIKIAEQFLDELFSSLETQETQSSALLQFLKDHGKATDEQLAPYMEQASRASNVRWRAARLRLMSLLSSAVKTEQQRQSSEPEKGRETQPKQEPEQRNTPPHPTQKAEDDSKKDPSPSGQKASESISKDENQDVPGGDRSKTEQSHKVAPQPETAKEASSKPEKQDAA